MSARELSNGKIIFGSILRPKPSRTYSKKGKSKTSDIQSALKPTAQEDKRQARSDPLGVRPFKKRLRDLLTHQGPEPESCAGVNEVEPQEPVGHGEEGYQCIEQEEEGIQVEEECPHSTISLDNDISFLPEYSDPEEDSIDDSVKIIDTRHSSPASSRHSSGSGRSSVAKLVGRLCQQDEVEDVNETKETKAEQEDEKIPTQASCQEHRPRTSRPSLHQSKGLRRRPYLIFNKTPSHRLKQLPKSEKKKSIFASRHNLGDGFSNTETKRTGLVLLTRNGRHSAPGPNFGPLDVTQTESPTGKSLPNEHGLRNKRKARRLDMDDNSFEPLPKKLKKATPSENLKAEKLKAAKPDRPQPKGQKPPSGPQRTIVNSAILETPEENEKAAESLPEVSGYKPSENTAPQYNAEENKTATPKKVLQEEATAEEQEQPHQSSDGFVQFIIPNSEGLSEPDRCQEKEEPDPNCSWETYIPESSGFRASSVPAPSHSSPHPLPSPLTKKKPSSSNLKARTPQASFCRTLRRINTH